MNCFSVTFSPLEGKCIQLFYLEQNLRFIVLEFYTAPDSFAARIMFLAIHISL